MQVINHELSDKLVTMESLEDSRYKGIKFKSPFRTEITATDENGDTLFTLEHNMVVLGGALKVLEKMWNIRSSLVIDTINNIAAINPEEQSVDVVPQDDYVCLWGIGIGGSGEAFGSVRDVKFYEREIGQNGYTTQMIPFRVTPAAIDGVDSKYYLRKKMIYPNTSSTDAFYSYYAKEFEVEPFIRTLLRDGAEGEDGSEVTDGVHDRQPTYEIETFVEMHLKLEKSDAREYFEYNGNIEQARINTIGLFTGRKVAIDILDSTGLKVGTRYDYKDVKLFSKFNFDNEALVNKKEINFTYRIYVS